MFKKLTNNKVIKNLVTKALPIIALIVLIAMVESGTGRLALAAVLLLLLGKYAYTLYKYWDMIKGIYQVILVQEQAKQLQKKMAYEKKVEVKKNE